MISVPVFNAHLRVTPIPGEGVLLLTERGAFALREAAFRHVIPLIDGQRSAEEIVAALDGVLDPATAWHALMQLEAAGHIVERDAAGGADAAFWLTLGADPAAAAAALGNSTVRIFSKRPSLAARCGAALEAFGAPAPTVAALNGTAPGEPRTDLDILLTDDYLDEALPAFGAAARAGGQRWLLARPAGAEIWIGPLFEPGEAPCPACLRRRLGQRRPAHRLAALHDPGGGTGTPLGETAATVETGCLLVAAEAARTLAGVDPAIGAAVWSFNLGDRGSRLHRLIAHPACAACGEGPAAAAAPPALRSRPVGFDVEGGYRTVVPEAMLRTYEHLVSPITGVVGTLTPGPTVEGAGRSYLADDIVGGRSNTIRSLIGRYRGASNGKGIADAQARASALGEALERYSSRFQGTELKLPGAFRELGDDAIHPNRLMNFSNRQYREREDSNARHGPLDHVPEPFDPGGRVDWTPVWSLTGRRHKLLPSDLLYYGPDPGGDRREAGRFCVSCTNGCAAGTTLEEAVLQGFLELAERDAAAMWWYNRVRRPAVDLDTFGDPWLSELAGRYDAVDREIVALDLTNDLGIPVFAGLSHCRSGGRERILLGLGCHLDPRIALQRAMTEMCQMLAADLEGSARTAEMLGGGWLNWATRENQPYLAPDGAAPVRRRGDFPNRRFGDLLDCIEFCRRRVEALGMEMLVLDLTRADIRMPAARVLVPGLRHFRPRFAPGRLYDVPVALGWVPAPTAEADLNPVPFIW